MSDELLEPLDADLDALLHAERTAQPSPAALERVWARVAAPPVTPGSPSTRTGSWLAAHAAPVAVAAFVLGGVTGAGLYATLRPSPPARVVAPTPSSPPPTSSFDATVPWTVAPAPPPPTATAPAGLPSLPTHVNAPAPAASSSLSAERLVLDAARTALTAGDADRALSLLADHARRFSRPQLAEEREALAIQALATEGRYDEARARADRFRALAPNSLFLPAVDATLGSIP